VRLSLLNSWSNKRGTRRTRAGGMDVRDFIVDVATGYNRLDGLATPTQQLLRSAGQELAEHVPGGLQVIGSGGKGSATFSPWVGIFDPDETASPQRGFYVVYLFSEDLETVALSLNQGIEELTRQIGVAGARRRLAADARAIRKRLDESLIDLDPEMYLGSVGYRQRAYEAGNIVARTYWVDALPNEETLRADLHRFLEIYQLAIAAKRELLLTSPGLIATSSPIVERATDDPLRDFKPKDDGDYVSHIEGRRLVKSRRHERLVADYGAWAASYGWRPSTGEHPKDIVLRGPGGTWIVEAKVIRRGNATEAVRTCLGQLYTYHHFLPSDPGTRLVGLFSEPIGDAFVSFLEECHVASVWKDGHSWSGSPSALMAYLAERYLSPGTEL
jgi:hypothetical protein